jgi:hypothetical protein
MSNDNEDQGALSQQEADSRLFQETWGLLAQAEAAHNEQSEVASQPEVVGAEFQGLQGFVEMEWEANLNPDRDQVDPVEYANELQQQFVNTLGAYNTMIEQGSLYDPPSPTPVQQGGGSVQGAQEVDTTHDSNSPPAAAEQSPDQATRRRQGARLQPGHSCIRCRVSFSTIQICTDLL